MLLLSNKRLPRSVALSITAVTELLFICAIGCERLPMIQAWIRACRLQAVASFTSASGLSRACKGTMCKWSVDAAQLCVLGLRVWSGNGRSLPLHTTQCTDSSLCVYGASIYNKGLRDMSEP